MRPFPRHLALGAFLVALSGISDGRVTAQAPEPEAVLVIEGGTLIDGNGGAPVADSVIVIRGNRIGSVSKRGQVSYPAGAHVIHAAGKFVMPGLFDSQVSYEWYLAEPLLNRGPRCGRESGRRSYSFASASTSSLLLATSATRHKTPTLIQSTRTR